MPLNDAGTVVNGTAASPVPQDPEPVRVRS